MSPRRQLSFFESAPALPEGFRYRDAIISPEDEQALIARFAPLDFKPFEFQGFLGRRRVVFFGYRYDFNDHALGPAEEIPEFLLPLRDAAVRFAEKSPHDFPHALITEYSPGAAIGWHKDRPDFGDVVGISLLSPCTFRFRRRKGPGWERASLTVEPRSAYLLTGPSRTEWQHSIPAVDRLRYSVTFRTLHRR
jgi:alkylated DNA repair dioxygenase AlkB